MVLTARKQHELIKGTRNPWNECLEAFELNPKPWSMFVHRFQPLPLAIFPREFIRAAHAVHANRLPSAILATNEKFSWKMGSFNVSSPSSQFRARRVRRGLRLALFFCRIFFPSLQLAASITTGYGERVLSPTTIHPPAFVQIIRTHMRNKRRGSWHTHGLAGRTRWVMAIQFLENVRTNSL